MSFVSCVLGSVNMKAADVDYIIMKASEEYQTPAAEIRDPLLKGEIKRCINRPACER